MRINTVLVLEGSVGAFALMRGKGASALRDGLCPRCGVSPGAWLPAAKADDDFELLSLD